MTSTMKVYPMMDLVMEWFQADVRLLLGPLPVDEKVNQYGDGNRINPYFGRGEPI